MTFILPVTLTLTNAHHSISVSLLLKIQDNTKRIFLSFIGETSLIAGVLPNQLGSKDFGEKINLHQEQNA